MNIICKFVPHICKYMPPGYAEKAETSGHKYTCICTHTYFPFYLGCDSVVRPGFLYVTSSARPLETAKDRAGTCKTQRLKAVMGALSDRKIPLVYCPAFSAAVFFCSVLSSCRMTCFGRKGALSCRPGKYGLKFDSLQLYSWLLYLLREFSYSMRDSSETFFSFISFRCLQRIASRT